MKRIESTLAVAACAVLAVGCASAPEPVKKVEAPRAKPAKLAKAKPKKAKKKKHFTAMPTSCADANAAVCTPPKDFVESLCKSHASDLALSMFAKDTPWERAYIGRDMEAWYASGARSSPKQVKRFEEVIILANRGSGKKGMTVSGTGSYDVYRWDGSCVSVMADELATFRPSQPNVARIRWKRLDDGIKEKLEKDRKIAYRNQQRRKACKGFDERGKRRCLKAELGLSRMIAAYVRRGGELPAPKLTALR